MSNIKNNKLNVIKIISQKSNQTQRYLKMFLYARKRYTLEAILIKYYTLLYDEHTL